MRSDPRRGKPAATPPEGTGFLWTEPTLMHLPAGHAASLVFALAVLPVVPMLMHTAPDKG